MEHVIIKNLVGGTFVAFQPFFATRDWNQHPNTLREWNKTIHIYIWKPIVFSTKVIFHIHIYVNLLEVWPWHLYTFIILFAAAQCYTTNWRWFIIESFTQQSVPSQVATWWVHRCGDHGEFLYRAFLGPPGPTGFPSLWGWRLTNPRLELDATPSSRAIKASAAYRGRSAGMGWWDHPRKMVYDGLCVCLLLGFGRQISTIWMFGFCLCDSSCKSWQKSEKWWRGRENHHEIKSV